MSKPLFSFITCTYQCEHFIRRCYYSLSKQTIQDWEWVIVDDGSTDNTQNLIKQLIDSRIRYFRFDMNYGPGAARQYALKQAGGDWCAIIDMDDFCFPDRLEYADKARIAGYDFFCSASLLINNDYLVTGVRRFNNETYPHSFVPASLCGKTELLQAIGYSKFRRAEDQLMILTLANNYNGFYCEEPLYIYHETANVNSKKAFLGKFYLLLETVRMVYKGTLKFNSAMLLFQIKNIIKIFLLTPFILFPSAYFWTLRFRNQVPVSKSLRFDRKEFIHECYIFSKSALR